jgi:hypothetical protein
LRRDQNLTRKEAMVVMQRGAQTLVAKS